MMRGALTRRSEVKEVVASGLNPGKVTSGFIRVNGHRLPTVLLTEGKRQSEQREQGGETMRPMIDVISTGAFTEGTMPPGAVRSGAVPADAGQRGAARSRATRPQGGMGIAGV